jgi:hypothetical protein
VARARPQAHRAPLWRGEALAPLEFLRLLTAPVFWGAGAASGEDRPVLVIPGFLASDYSVLVMLTWLQRLGYAAVGADVGFNVSCSEQTAARLETRIDRLVERHGKRATVIGHSRGGTLARVLGVRRPDLVSSIVTIATPPLDLQGVHPLLGAAVRGLDLAGSAGRGPVFGRDCFVGSCCERFRVDLGAPVPQDVSYTAIAASRDGLVPFRRCLDPAAEAVEVDASHIGALVSPEVFRAVVRALNREGRARQAASG